MLRRLLGDEAFFRGLRRFYADRRYQKAGTDDFERAMETESGRTLDRFFERWIYGSSLPHIRYSSSVEGQEVVVRFEQSGEIFDVPVTVTMTFNDRHVAEEVVSLTEAVVEWRFPIVGTLRTVTVNADQAALGDFDRK